MNSEGDAEHTARMLRRDAKVYQARPECLEQNEPQSHACSVACQPGLSNVGKKRYNCAGATSNISCRSSSCGLEGCELVRDSANAAGGV